MTLFDQGREVTDKQRTQQGGNVQTVRVRIGENAHLAITQLGQIIATRFDTQRHGDVVNFLRAKHFGGIHFPAVQDLAAQRHDRLKLAAARLLCRASSGITLDQKQFRLGRIITGAVGQLAG